MLFHQNAQGPHWDNIRTGISLKWSINNHIVANSDGSSQYLDEHNFTVARQLALGYLIVSMVIDTQK